MNRAEINEIFFIFVVGTVFYVVNQGILVI